MATSSRTPPPGLRLAALAPLLAGLAGLAVLALLLGSAAPAHPGWLARISGMAEQAGARVGRVGAGALDNAAAHVKSLPGSGHGTALAAQATQEGHWRFVNRTGETFTAGTPEEMQRVAAVLLPDAAPDARLTLYLAEDTLFLHRKALADLPAGAQLRVVVARESYAVLRRSDAAGEPLFAQVRPNLVVAMSDRAGFAEAVWQLARPLDKSSVRVLALEPSGPPRLAPVPRIDPATKRPQVDVIDPASLPAALGTARGQMLLLTGRVDGRVLYVQPSSGAERSVLLPDLFKAAEDADVNLVVLRTASTPRQPGGRNWLWQRVEVKGLEQAMQHPRVADFLDALGAGSGRLAVSATASGRRATLDVRPATDLAGPAQRPVGDLFSGIVSDITGRVVTVGLQASVRSAERQQELDQRLIPGVPSDLQLGYVALVALGLLGVPVSLAWWRRIWPPESRSDYAGRSGYWAAQAVRWLAFLLLFLPLTAPVSAPYSLLRQAWEAATAPVRWWRLRTRGGAAAAT